jgi:hypothetical protein
VLDTAILETAHTHRPIELLVESDEFYRARAVEYHDGPRVPHLVGIDGRPDTRSTVAAAHAGWSRSAHGGRAGRAGGSSKGKCPVTRSRRHT